MNSRLINNAEIDIIFYEELTQIQLKHIFNIISILAKYMLLTTDMLMELYQRTYHEKMGLSYLKRAVKEKLIIEYQYDLDEESEKKEYYYALKGSTYNYLSQNRIAFLKLPPQAAYEEKSRILTCNKYLIEHDYQPNISMVLDSNLQYFFTIQNVICYFHNLITPQEIKKELEQKKIQIVPSFEVVTGAMIEIGQFTKAVNPKDLD